jgi:hypothetical protein
MREIDPAMTEPIIPTQARLGERGFVLAQSALLLIPLLIFAAFATDIGSWYVEGHKVQRGADAAALAGVTYLPDVAAAEQAARDAAARNGYLDATPTDNGDFDTGPLPQVRVTAFGSEGLEVEIKTEATAYLGRIVVDSIEVERYGVAEFIQPVHLGNPTSGLGTGDISPAALGLPNDQMWLSINAYCSDHEQGDPFAVGYYDGPFNSYVTCDSSGTPSGVSSPNPIYDPDAYIFVAEYQPGSPTIDIDVYEPGTQCSDSGNTGDRNIGPILYFEIYGPSNTTDHMGFINSNSPIATVSHPRSACISNAPDGDGWWPLLQNAVTPSADGGFYYVKAGSRNPTSPDAYPADNFYAEYFINNFSLRTVRSGSTTLCAFSIADPTCPQLYALDWLPLYREAPNNESAFYLAEVDPSHAGEKMVVTFFDAAEDIANLQFVDSNGTAMPFTWRYTDQSDGGLTTSEYWETAAAPSSSTCSWGGVGGNPCLVTTNRPDWNDHFVRIEIDIPGSYTCGADCWWQIRYVTGATPTDRSTWSIFLEGDPVRLVE